MASFSVPTDIRTTDIRTDGRNAEGDLTTSEGEEDSEGSVTTRELPREDQTAVVQFVRRSIFPDLKLFGNKRRELAYSENPVSLCQVVLGGCNARDREDRHEWWSQATKCISRTLCRLRSDKVQGIKKGFNGK